eukprot:2179067-Amphidinium_carterae.1
MMSHKALRANSFTKPGSSSYLCQLLTEMLTLFILSGIDITPSNNPFIVTLTRNSEDHFEWKGNLATEDLPPPLPNPKVSKDISRKWYQNY